MSLAQASLHALMPRADAILWMPALESAMAEFAINTAARRAAFLAQLAHESRELTLLEENLNYSAAGLLKTWPKRFTEVSAAAYARQPERIANYVYAKRNGNGDEASGDGWTYRGRGPIQLTGRGNYAKAARALGLDLEGFPTQVLTPIVGARVAGWYWQTHLLNALADAGDVEGITKAINGGLNGLDERLAYYRRALQALAA